MIDTAIVISKIIQVFDLLQPCRAAYDMSQDLGNLQVIVDVDVEGFTQDAYGVPQDFAVHATCYCVAHRDFDPTGALRNAIANTISNATIYQTPSEFNIPGYRCDAIINPTKTGISNFGDNFTSQNVTFDLIYQRLVA